MRVGRNELPPRHDSDYREIDRQINRRDAHDAEQDRTRDRASRILDFVADVADVVVPEVVVDADAGGSAQPDEKTDREIERARGKIEGDRAIEVRHAGEDHRCGGEEASDPERDCQRTERSDRPVQQRKVQHTHRRRDHRVLHRREGRPEIPEVLRKADVARRDLEGTAQDELPDEEKRREAAPLLAAVPLAKVDVASARSRHRRSELAPDHAIRNHDEQRNDPSEHRLWTAERGHEQRDRDERPDSHHVGHVESSGLEQAEPAGQLRRMTAA